MPEYLYPGVYVEEVDTGNKPIEGVSTSTVGFLGLTERGPRKPTLITSFPEFRQTFGSYLKEGGLDRYLAYGVEGFFQNGGQRCFVARVASAKAQSATLELDAKIIVTALGPGLWGNNVAVQIAAPGLKNPALFKLVIAYWSGGLPNPLPDLTKPNELRNSPPTLMEVFDNLSMVAGSGTFYQTEINDISNLVVLEPKAPEAPGVTPVTSVTPAAPATALAAALQKGTDGDPVGIGDFKGDDTDPENKTGLVALGDIDEISLLCCPDEHQFGTDPTITLQLVAQCENLGDRFAILQSDGKAKQPDDNDPPQDSKYAAFYYPWLKVTNPLTGIPLPVPPGGHIAGIYARSDTNRGVHKDPANEVIRGIDALQLQINNQEQAILNPKGVNALRYFKGSGNLVWGGRTISHDPDWKYINVRRLFIFVEKSIERSTQWVVFEPNDEPLWARLRRSVGAFLTRLWMDGMLQGLTKEEAYFVRCDRTTMTQADIDNGKLIMLIGIAPVKPAEFVIFRIGQWTGGSDVTEG